MIYVSEVRLKKDLPDDSYLNSLAAVRHLAEGNPLRFDRPVTFFVGENGMGKSTLLEGIAVCCGFNPEGGSRHFNFSTRSTHSSLGDCLLPIREAGIRHHDGFFLRAESFYNVATYLDNMKEEPFGGDALRPYGGLSLHEQSHGESFLALVQNRFRGHGLYLLDEPEAALSPSRLLTLLAEIDWLVREDSQFIISTHSPILMAFPNARIYQLTEDGIEATDYRDTEHFRITKQFLDDPERMLHYLLDRS